MQAHNPKAQPKNEKDQVESPTPTGNTQSAAPETNNTPVDTNVRSDSKNISHDKEAKSDNSTPDVKQTIKSSTRASIGSQTLSLNGIKTILVRYLDVQSTGNLSRAHSMFSDLWIRKSRWDFKFEPDPKTAAQFYKLAAIQAGFFRPLGYWHNESEDDFYQEQLVAIKINHPDYDYYLIKDKQIFFRYCDKTLELNQPDFRIVKGLLNLAIFNHEQSKGEDNDDQDDLDRIMYAELKAERHKLEQLLMKLIGKESNNSIQGAAYFALYLVTNDPRNLEIARTMKNPGAIFHYARIKFDLLHHAPKESEIRLPEIFSLIEEAANLENGPACCLLGLGLLHVAQPLLNIQIEEIDVNERVDKTLREFSGSTENLLSLISQAAPFLEQRYATLSEDKSQHASRFNSAGFTRLLTSITAENAIEKLAIHLLKIAALQKSDIAVRALIIYFADKNDAVQTIDYLLQYSVTDGFQKWFSLGLAFRDGGYLDLRQFVQQQVQSLSPYRWTFATPTAPSEMQLNIGKDPKKAVFCLKQVFRQMVNGLEYDGQHYLLELPLSFCHGADSVYPNSCIPQDAKQAADLLEITAQWAAKQHNLGLHNAIIAIFRKGEGCLPPMRELADKLETQYATLQAEYDNEINNPILPSPVDADLQSEEEADSSADTALRFSPRSS